MNKSLLPSLIFLIIGMSLSQASAYGATLQLPQALYSIDDLVAEFRNPLRLKAEDLKKNYRAKSSNNVIVYDSHEPVTCSFQTIPANTILAKVEYFYREVEKEGLSVLRYFGCNEELSLVERFLRVGGEGGPLNFREFTEGKLSFELKKSEERYHYELQNKLGENLFSLSARWLTPSRDSSLYSFSMRGQEFLRVRTSKTASELRVYYTFESFNVAYQYLPYFKSNVSQNHDGFTFKVLVKEESPNIPLYLSSMDTLLSQNTFIQFFSYWAIKNGLAYVKQFVDFHLYWFPPTEFVNSGGQSQRLVNELRLNLNRILNNTNLNLVEVYLRNLIQSVEAGQVTDRRPVE